jgi:hypothetical protein
MKITTRTLIPIIVLMLLALGAVGVASAQNFSDIAGTIRNAVTRQGASEMEITGTIISITPETWTVDGTEFSVLPQTEVDGAFVVGDVVKVHLYTAADGSLAAREIEFAESGVSNGNSNDNGEMDDDNGNVNANDNSEIDDDNGNDNSEIDDDNGNTTSNDNGEIEEDDDNTNSNDNGEIEDDDDSANSNDNGSINENSNANDDDSNDNGNINENGNGNEDDSDDDHAGDHDNGNSNDHHDDDDHGGAGGNDNGDD